MRQPTPGSLAEYLDRNQVTSTSDSRRKVVAVEISPIALSLQADVELQDQGRQVTDHFFPCFGEVCRPFFDYALIVFFTEVKQ